MDQSTFSEACERNKEPILEVLKEHFGSRSSVLEIGSGTGQHAAYFSSYLTWLHWQPTDMLDRISVLRQRCETTGLKNLLSPLALNVFEPWPDLRFDALFSANTLHIIPVEGAQAIFSGIASRINPGFRVAIYGPFKFGGEYTSNSNEIFDKWLFSRNTLSGIRDFEAVDAAAQENGLSLIENYQMPANNQLVIWGN